MFIFNYSEENLDYKLDPLHFEPKRIRKRQDKCHVLNANIVQKQQVVCRDILKLKTKGWNILALSVSMLQRQRVV